MTRFYAEVLENPSCGRYGDLKHPYGAIRDDGSIDNGILWKQARSRARRDHAMGINFAASSDYPAIPYREHFQHALDYYRSYHTSRFAQIEREVASKAPAHDLDAQLVLARADLDVARFATFPDPEVVNAIAKRVSKIERQIAERDGRVVDLAKSRVSRGFTDLQAAE